MNVLAVILAVVDIILAIGMVILFLVQEGNDRGMGVVGGTVTNDSYYSKTKGRSLEEQLKFYTKVDVVIFVIVSILLFLVVTKGW